MTAEDADARGRGAKMQRDELDDTAICGVTVRFLSHRDLEFFLRNNLELLSPRTRAHSHFYLHSSRIAP